MRALVVFLLTLMILPTAAAAEPFQVGVIVSRQGPAQNAGAAQALAATAYASRLRAQGGIFGLELEVLLRDDAGDPRSAADHATALIDEGVDALICCTTSAAAKAVARRAESAGVLLLSPSGLDGDHYWSFTLALSERDDLAAIVADAHRRGIWSVALMSLDNGFGDDAAADLEALLGVAGMGLAGAVRYKPGTLDLRPEALWIATRQAGAVLVWGLKGDLLAAVDGLRRRGYDGPIYARSALLDPVAGGLDLGRLEGVRFAVPPSTVADGLDPSTRCRSEAASVARQLRAAYQGLVDVALATPVYDALDLLRQGLEQVAMIPLPEDRPAVKRQALRDSLVGLAPTCGGGGLYDLREGKVEALMPGAVAFAEVRRAALAPLP